MKFKEDIFKGIEHYNVETREYVLEFLEDKPNYTIVKCDDTQQTFIKIDGGIIGTTLEGAIDEIIRNKITEESVCENIDYEKEYNMQKVKIFEL